MLSIGSMKSGQGFYYAHLAREDYYLDGGEPPGHWYGAALNHFRLDGDVMSRSPQSTRVEAEQLHQLMQGYGPLGPLVQNAGETAKDGKRGRKAGYDLTFSPDKSVSVLWAYSSKEQRARIEACVMDAAKAALDVCEGEAGWVRAGAQGAEHLQADLLFALFPHSTSRAQDAQLHVHALCMNVGFTDDGKSRALYEREIYRHKMMLGAVFKTELTKLLHDRLGVGIEVDDETGRYRIRGVPKELCEAHSSRRRQIEDELAKLGYSTAKAADLANARTRPDKGHLPRPELDRKWMSVIDDLEMTLDGFHEAVDRGRGRVQQPGSLREKAQAQAERLAKERATFRKQDLYVAVQRGCADGVTTHRDIMQAVEAELGSRRVAVVGRGMRHPLYTTAEQLRNERGILNTAWEMVQQPGHAVDATHVERIKAEEVFGTLNSSERVAAFEYLTRERGDLKVLSGVAGSAKTSLLKAAREAYEAQGYNVVGMAVAARAARKLSEQTGIESQTVRLRLIQFDEAARRRLAENLTLKPIRDRLSAKQLKDNLTLKPLRDQVSPQRLLDNAMLKPLFAALSPRQLRDNLLLKGPRENLSWDEVRKNFTVAGVADHVSLDAVFAGKRSLFNRRLSRQPRPRNLPDVKLDDKTVLVVDEASMLGLQDATDILRHARSAGAQVVMVAGHGQLPAIKDVSPVKAVQRHIGGGFELRTVLRQKKPWMRDAVQSFADGDVKTGLSLLLSNGALHLESRGSVGAKAHLLQTWAKDQRPVDERAIFVSTNEERLDFNQRVQSLRQSGSELGDRSVQLGSGERAHVGDRVTFLKNARPLGIDNGMLGTVVKIHRDGPLTFNADGEPVPGRRKGELTIETETGSHVRLNLDEYDDLTLAYAFTTHKGQGDTLLSTYVYTTPGDTHREMAYVQASRHADSIQVFAPGHSLRDEDLDELRRAMERETTHQLAVEREAQLIEDEQKRLREQQQKREAAGLELEL